MANLQKIAYVYWLDENGKRVKAGTPGARKHTEESTKYYAVWREGKRHRKVPLCADKEAAQALMTDLMRTKDRVKARLVDPRQHHYDRPLAAHLDEFLPVMRSKGKSEKNKDRKESILRAFCGNLRTLPD